jgi:hypothetical protein
MSSAACVVNTNYCKIELINALSGGEERFSPKSEKSRLGLVCMSYKYISLRRKVKMDAPNMTEKTPSNMAISGQYIACRLKILLAS